MKKVFLINIKKKKNQKYDNNNYLIKFEQNIKNIIEG